MDQATLTLIKGFEGMELKPYRDSAGVLTVGVGHVIQQNEPELLNGITEDEAMKLLEADARQAEKTVVSSVRIPLNANQLAALTSFTFNVGAAAFRRSTLLRKLNNNDPLGAASEFDRWVHAGDQTVPGLVRRRSAEKALFLKPVLCKVGT